MGGRKEKRNSFRLLGTRTREEVEEGGGGDLRIRKKEKQVVDRTGG